MADDKKKLVALTSPKLTFKFPKLSEPDFGTKDYPKPDGEYSVKGIGKASDPAVQAFIKALTPLHDEAVADGEAEFKTLKAETRRKLGSVKVNDIFTEVLDKDTEQPTGEVEFKFSMRASGEYKKGPKTGKRWHRSPAIFDAKGRAMKVVPEIWGGSTGRISFEITPYFIPGTGAAGMKLNLTAVQVIDLVAGGQRNASAYGFGAEDGYEHEEPDQVPPADDDDRDQDSGNASRGKSNPDF